MAKRVFISYRHQKAEWVQTVLYPILSAAGVDVVIDYKEFAAGLAVRRQMKAAQDRAEIQLLLFTPDYFTSEYCLEEMQRAFTLDPDFSKGVVLPVILESCDLPVEIMQHQPVYVDLTGSRQSEGRAWELLTERCEASLGTTVPEWFVAFKRVTQALRMRNSVNLLVTGRPKWRELVAEVKRCLPQLAVIDLEAGKTATQRGLESEILRALMGFDGTLPKEDEHLARFERLIETTQPGLLALQHFDKVRERAYTGDFYSSLRFLVAEKRLTLLIQSRSPFAGLLPTYNPLSCLELETIELRGGL